MTSFEPIRRIESRIFVLADDNIDTDQIIPARFLTTTVRDGLAEGCFHDRRFSADGALTAHPLNTTPVGEHRILVAGDNFGCGSSREHAPWALLEFGFRVVISTGIADIFRSNSLKNGLLPITVPQDVHARLVRAHGAAMHVDLERQELRFGDVVHGFDIEAFARACLLEGRDSLDVLLAALPAIEAFEGQRHG